MELQNDSIKISKHIYLYIALHTQKIGSKHYQHLNSRITTSDTPIESQLLLNLLWGQIQQPFLRHSNEQISLRWKNVSIILFNTETRR